MTLTARRRFAHFYRSRPLVGGSLIALSGVAIFLSTQLDLGRIHIQVGVEGFQSILIPIALVVLGVLVVADPSHRIFYGVIALAVAIYAIVGVNLGGFLVGTLLGLAGAVVALSWMPPPVAYDLDVSPTVDAMADDTMDADPLGLEHVENLLTPDETPAPEPPPFPRRPADAGRAGRRGLRTLALAGAVTLVAGGAAAGVPGQAAHAESAVCVGLLSVLCPPSSSPSPMPSDTAAPSPLPSSATASPAPAEPGPPATSPQPAPTPLLPPGVPPSAAALVAAQSPAADVGVDASAPVVAAETATLSASYLSQTNGRYVDTVLLRHPDGSTVRALKILGDAGLLKNVRLHGAGGHHGAGIDASELDVAGPIHFYAAAFSGRAFGILPLTWNVDSPPPLDVPMPPFTDVTVELVFFDAGGQTLTASHITPQ